MTALPSSSRSPRRGLLLLVLALFVGAAVWALASRRHDLADALHQLSWAAVTGSLVLAVVAVLAMLMSWDAAVRDGGVDLPFRDMVRIYCVGQVGKYVPGSVWPVLTQSQLARRRGSSPARVASGSLLALAVSVCVFLAVGAALLPLSSHEAAARLWWVPLAVVPMVVALHPAILNRALAVAGRVLRRGAPDFAYTLPGVLRCSAWALVGAVAFGGHVYLLADSLGGGGLRGFALSTCAFALATGVGVLVIFAPAGAGVREAVLTLVLAPVLSVDAALVIALVSRAMLIVVDLGLGLSQVYGLRHWSASAEDGAGST